MSLVKPMPLYLMVALLMTGCAPEPAQDEVVLRPVRSRLVEISGAPRARTFTGITHAAAESKLSFRVGGTVRQVRVAVGDRVRKGQMLAELDPSDSLLQVDSARASLDQAAASSRSATAEYDRVRGLYENDNASKSELDRARANAEASAAQQVSAAAQLSQAERQLAYTRLESPVSGSVAIVSVEPGENVQAGQTVSVLTSGQKLEVEVAVPDSLIAGVKQGEPVVARVPALPGEELAGVITEVGVATVADATTYPVTVQIDPPAGLRPGMAAEVDIRFGDDESARRIYLPPAAVGEDLDGRFVFILEDLGDGTGVVHRRAVEIGELNADGLEIVTGLGEGERVVTAGVRRLEDQRTVRVDHPGTAP